MTNLNAIETKDLTRSFPGGFCLDKVSFTLPQGCIMGLIGENGAGKSTLCRLLLGTLRSDAGEAFLLGQPVSGPGQSAYPASLREDIGVVLDNLGIPECLTAVQLGKVMRRVFTRWSDEKYAEYLKRFAVPENKTFKELSRGMKMKLTIAVALSHDPKLLILDEPTNGLDPVARDEFLDVLSDFTREENHSVLVSSHIVSDLEKVCDYISFLHEGRLIVSEEKDLLLSRYALLHCDKEDLAKLPKEALVHVRETQFSAEAVVIRTDSAGKPLISENAPGMHLAPVSIEELFIAMVKK